MRPFQVSVVDIHNMLFDIDMYPEVKVFWRSHENNIEYSWVKENFSQVDLTDLLGGFLHFSYEDSELICTVDPRKLSAKTANACAQAVTDVLHHIDYGTWTFL